MLKIEAIKNYLKAKTHPDLSALYNENMEVQVNVAKDNGELIVRTNKFQREVREWSDGVQTWKPFRIPYNANTTPEYKDSELKFSLEEHCEGIGMTGWDWVNRRSLWVAYDFDAITGHSDKHARKLTDQQLTEVKEAVNSIPFATLRLSTSGKGLHLYVFLKPVETANHNEHAAVARSILSLMSGMIGFDFTSKVDVAGSNMWVWHRKMLGTDGLRLLKQGTVLEQVPLNWREHIDVVTRKRTRTLPQFINEEPSLFEELTSQRTKVALDDEHKKLINWLSKTGACWWWDNDSWMLVTHTYHLKQAHEALNFKGKYSTLSTGTELGVDHNCFLYPLRGGSWSVRRYSRGTTEAETWEQDGKGWTTCFYNKNTDLQVSAKINKGVEHPKGGYVFKSADLGVAALKDIGIDLKVPSWAMKRQLIIRRLKNENKLTILLNSEMSDPTTEMTDWLHEKKQWIKIVKYNFPADSELAVNENYDDLVRHIYDESNTDAGWLMLRDNQWCSEPLVHVKTLLKSLDNDTKDLDVILGKAIANAWKIVCRPFVPEYPGNREWNRGAAQFAVPPSTDIDNLKHPTWDKILKHCGNGLNDVVTTNKWCIENGILNGSDYLKLWLVSLIKHPERPLPYLGFYGEQDSGKSIFHEMLEFIISNGIQRADIALSSTSGFNGELQNAILCVIEETDLKKNKTAYNRIKDWVTAPKIMIHIKNATPYSVPNYCHFIQCANELEFFPVFPGDTRMTLVHVASLKEEEKVGKELLKTLLKKEASDFLAHLLSIDIPEFNDRLAIPMLVTEGKINAEARNMTPLEAFIAENCYPTPGQCILAIDFYEKFLQYLDENERPLWSRQRVGRELPDKFPKGKLGDMKTYYGNITFHKDEPARPPYRIHGQFIRMEGT